MIMPTTLSKLSRPGRIAIKAAVSGDSGSRTPHTGTDSVCQRARMAVYTQTCLVHLWSILRDTLYEETRRYAEHHRRNFSRAHAAIPVADVEEKAELASLKQQLLAEIKTKEEAIAARDQLRSLKTLAQVDKRKKRIEAKAAQQQAAMDALAQLDKEVDAFRKEQDARWANSGAAPPLTLHQSDRWIDVRLRQIRSFLGEYFAAANNPIPQEIARQISKYGRPRFTRRFNQINNRIHGGDLRTDIMIAQTDALEKCHNKALADWFRHGVFHVYGNLPWAYFALVLEALEDKYKTRSWYQRLHEHESFIDKYAATRAMSLENSRPFQVAKAKNIHVKHVFERIEMTEKKFRPYMLEFGKVCKHVTTANPNHLVDETEADQEVASTKLDELNRLRFEVFDTLKNWIEPKGWSILANMNQLDPWPPTDFFQNPDPLAVAGQSASPVLPPPPTLAGPPSGVQGGIRSLSIT
ncbi:hypothetical protein QBC43DRAFT_360671 [Cladorrhinum sp. PSN259]|nr:hypothetical protein QBC43DRAFT_360671 [Cladorrhinum sp. PSN259]